MQSPVDFLAGFAGQWNQLTFHPNPDWEGLPFPLYLDVKWKVLISIGMILGLIYGLRLRFIIISYLRFGQS